MPLGLYLHVPFCRKPCPYCPYNRVKYEDRLYRKFESAAHLEIDNYSRLIREANQNSQRPEISSLYVGGGTPTIEPESLIQLIEHIKDVLGSPDDICVELHPNEMDDKCLDLLKNAEVNMVSIGVETLNDRLLGIIGRSHDSEIAVRAIKRAVAKGFDTVNIDLMFALPTQETFELDNDLCRIFNLGIDQISAYPIFGFPYTEYGRKYGKEISAPPGNHVRNMLSLIQRRSIEHGYQQCSVWSFARPKARKFSSVTRNHYIGFGPGAASMTGKQFYINTFSIEEYASSLPARLPVALILPVTNRLEKAFWLYWCIYKLNIPVRQFSELFGDSLEEEFGSALNFLKFAGLLKRENGSYTVTENGAYWIHRVQNEYSLNYIDRLWGKCRQEAWPSQAVLH
jgi:oxygen-independent coproporphyrinogen-3 oxidase